jgi:hypothetical protein
MMRDEDLFVQKLQIVDKAIMNSVLWGELKLYKDNSGLYEEYPQIKCKLKTNSYSSGT